MFKLFAMDQEHLDHHFLQLNMDRLPNGAVSSSSSLVHSLPE